MSEESFAAPNTLQLEFIRRVAPQYRYMAFADANHQTPEIRLFVFHEKMVAALEAAGKKTFFLEEPPENQPYFDSLRQQSDNLALGKLSDRGTSKKDMEILCNVFENTARDHPTMHFVAAERRAEDILFANISPEDIPKLKKMVLITQKARAANLPFDVNFTAELLGLKQEIMDKFLENVTGNDNLLAQYIESFPGEGSIFLGGFHFSTDAELNEKPARLGSLLVEHGNPTCVVAIYKNEAQEQEFINSLQGTIKPDAALYIQPPSDCPTGIRIINPALQAFI